MNPTAAIALVVLFLASSGCVDDGGAAVSSKRGAPAAPAGGGGDAKAAARPKAAAASPTADEAAAAVPERPPIALDAKSFQRRRDPFLNVVPEELVVAEPDRPRANRKVELQKYAFEDLKLVAIVHAGRAIKPRALFVASDGKSHAIAQGQYFSSAEVLLVSVGRDSVEIEVVDDDLASSLNLQRGERRAINLRKQ